MISCWENYVLAGPFDNAEHSDQVLEARNDKYPGYTDMMPTTGFEGGTVLDFGCGPGHDTLMFARNGASVFAADISELALNVTRDRLALHGLAASLVKVGDPPGQLPRVDHIHCAGVLHHTRHPIAILEEFEDALRPGGDVRLAVYDGTALPGGMKTQEGLAIWWTHAQVAELAGIAGFNCDYIGTYPLPMACYRLTR